MAVPDKGNFVPTLRKTVLAFAATALTITAVSAQAQLSSEQQKRAQSTYQEYRALQISMRVQLKCQTLDTLTYTAARITAELRKKSLLDMGATTEADLDAANGALQQDIDNQTCDGLAGNAVLSTANERATFYKDYYLYVWHEYREVVAAKIMLSDDWDDVSEYGCAGYTHDQINEIRPLSNAAWQVMKTKGYFDNAHAEAKNILKSCQNDSDTMKFSPAIQMLEAGFNALAEQK